MSWTPCTRRWTGLLETVAGGGVRDLSHDELTELTATVRREQARLDAVLLEAVGEVDARGGYTLDGALDRRGRGCG